MSLEPKEREILQFLLKKAEDGEEGLTTAFVCGQITVENGEAQKICNRLHTYGWIGPKSDMSHSEITAAGTEQLRPWWRRNSSPVWKWIAIIMTVVSLIIASLSYLSQLKK